MAENDLSFTFRVDGADETVRQTRRVGDALGGVEEKSKGLGQGLGQLRQGFAGAGQALSALVPGIGQATSGLGGFGQAIASVSTGMGAWGMVIGLTAAAIGKIATELADAKREAEEFTRSLMESTRSIGAFVEARQNDARQRARDELIAQGGGTPDESRLAAQGFRARAEGFRRQAASVDGGLFASDTQNRVNRRDFEIQAERLERIADDLDRRANAGPLVTEESGSVLVGDAARQAASGQGYRMTARDRARAEALDPFGGGGARGRGGGARGRPGYEARVYADDLGRSGTGGADAYLTGDIGRFLDQSGDPKGGNNVTRIDAQRRAEEQQRARTLDQERDWYQERTRQRDAYYDSWSDKGEEVGAAFGDMLNTVASGEQTLLQAAEGAFKNFLKQTARSESIEAGKAFAKAIGAAFVNPAAAAAYTAEGVAHLAVAAAAGGAQAIVRGGGGGGAARPDRVLGRGGEGGGGPLVINLNAPAMVTAGGLAALGREIRGAIDSGDRRYS